jgi:Xaa-Pro aminopeptidase
MRVRKTWAPCSFVVVALFASQLCLGMDRQPNADYRARREALVARLDGGMAILFAPNESEGPNDLYGYRPDDNFYYLTGWSEPGAAVLIAPAIDAKDKNGARPYTEILFLPSRNDSQEKWTGPKLGPENPEAAKITGFARVEVLDHLRDVLTQVLSTGKTTIYTDLPAYEDTSNSESALDWLKRANSFPVRISFEDIRPTLGSLRTFKDSGEIELLRKAADASIAAHFSAMRAVKPGVTEREVGALLQYEWGKRGCERPAYASIVGSGFYSTVLHYSENTGTMQAGDVVVIDAAGEYSMYAADITRTLPVSGKFTARQREIYDIVLGAQKAATAAFQSGKSTLTRTGQNSLYNVAFDYINTHGKDLHGQPLGQYFIHGLSHYIGLNVHDPGDYSVPLGPGAAFTIEPGIYIPEEKLGVRIEDDFLVDQNGKLVDLTAALPTSADEVEKAMTAR